MLSIFSDCTVVARSASVVIDAGRATRSRSGSTRLPRSLHIRDQFTTELASVAGDVVRARSAAERSGAKAQQQTIEAVKALADLGLSLRDAAELLGLSHRRIHQLLEAS